jgi:hypothetical protein
MITSQYNVLVNFSAKKMAARANEARSAWPVGTHSLKQSISINELAHAERLLFHFCVMFQPLYGHRHQTANIHSLVHLVDNVRELGPLWTHLCFNFEDKNGFLLKTVHGTQQIHFQIISALSMLKRLPELEK